MYKSIRNLTRRNPHYSPTQMAVADYANANAGLGENQHEDGFVGWVKRQQLAGWDYVVKKVQKA